jgi:folate-binding protein YgfZ
MFSHDEYVALREGAGLLNRSNHGRLHLTGADRRSYLHGLLTNDIVALSPGAGCYAALLTPQGRMISDMRVSELGERVLLDLPAETAAAVRKHLSDFIFSEDADVSDAGRSLTHLALYGPKASTVLAEVLTRPLVVDDAAARRERLDAMPSLGNAEWKFGETPVTVIQSDDFGVNGFELFIAPAAAAELSAALRGEGAVDVAFETAEVTRVESGRPAFGLDMDEHTIPLEAGIEDRAISLTKGCYVGQEIIIRVLHRGQGRVARRLVGFVGSSGSPLTRGERLSVGGKDVGVVTSAVVSPRLMRPIGLGYVHRDSAEPGTILQAGAAVASAASPEGRAFAASPEGGASATPPQGVASAFRRKDLIVVTTPFLQPATE